MTCIFYEMRNLKSDPVSNGQASEKAPILTQSRHVKALRPWIPAWVDELQCKQTKAGHFRIKMSGKSRSPRPTRGAQRAT